MLSESLHCDTPNVVSALDGVSTLDGVAVLAVLATPPNSYSGVIDAIDLACGRRGDISMLEVRLHIVV